MNKGFEGTVEDKCVKSIANFLFVPSPLPSLIFPTIFPVNTAGSRSTEHKLCLILQRKERKKEVWQNKGMEYTHTISWHPFKWHRVSVTEDCFIKKKRKKIRERESEHCKCLVWKILLIDRWHDTLLLWVFALIYLSWIWCWKIF